MKLVLVLLASVLKACVATVTVQDCPLHHQNDPRVRVFGDSCYVFVLDHQREFATAQRECAARHGHLAIIRDEATNQFLYNTMKHELNFGGIAFIGLSDAHSTGRWTWVDGSKPAYSNWGPGQPNGAGNCAAMVVYAGNGWYDYPCEETLFEVGHRNFICEYDIARKEETTTTTTTTTTTVPSSTTTTTTASTTTTLPTTTPTTTTTTTPVPTTTVPTTTTPVPTTTTTVPTTTTPVPTTTTTVPTTTTTVSMTTGCPAFECFLECGLAGYKISDMGCMLCQCED